MAACGSGRVGVCRGVGGGTGGNGVGKGGNEVGSVSYGLIPWPSATSGGGNGIHPCGGGGSGGGGSGGGGGSVVPGVPDGFFPHQFLPPVVTNGARVCGEVGSAPFLLVPRLCGTFEVRSAPGESISPCPITGGEGFVVPDVLSEVPGLSTPNEVPMEFVSGLATPKSCGDLCVPAAAVPGRSAGYEVGDQSIELISLRLGELSFYWNVAGSGLINGYMCWYLLLSGVAYLLIVYCFWECSLVVNIINMGN